MQLNSFVSFALSVWVFLVSDMTILIGNITTVQKLAVT